MQCEPVTLLQFFHEHFSGLTVTIVLCVWLLTWAFVNRRA